MMVGSGGLWDRVGSRVKDASQARLGELGRLGQTVALSLAGVPGVRGREIVGRGWRSVTFKLAELKCLRDTQGEMCGRRWMLVWSSGRLPAQV